MSDDIRSTCPVCKKRFDTPNALHNHFIIVSHGMRAYKQYKKIMAENPEAVLPDWFTVLNCHQEELKEERVDITVSPNSNYEEASSSQQDEGTPLSYYEIEEQDEYNFDDDDHVSKPVTVTRNDWARVNRLCPIEGCPVRILSRFQLAEHCYMLHRLHKSAYGEFEIKERTFTSMHKFWVWKINVEGGARREFLDEQQSLFAKGRSNIFKCCPVPEQNPLFMENRCPAFIHVLVKELDVRGQPSSVHVDYMFGHVGHEDTRQPPLVPEFKQEILDTYSNSGGCDAALTARVLQRRYWGKRHPLANCTPVWVRQCFPDNGLREAAQGTRRGRMKKSTNGSYPPAVTQRQRMAGLHRSVERMLQDEDIGETGEERVLKVRDVVGAPPKKPSEPVQRPTIVLRQCVPTAGQSSSDNMVTLSKRLITTPQGLRLVVGAPPPGCYQIIKSKRPAPRPTLYTARSTILTEDAKSQAPPMKVPKEENEQPSSSAAPKEEKKSGVPVGPAKAKIELTTKLYSRKPKRKYEGTGRRRRHSHSGQEEDDEPESELNKTRTLQAWKRGTKALNEIRSTMKAMMCDGDRGQLEVLANDLELLNQQVQLNFDGPPQLEEEEEQEPVEYDAQEPMGYEAPSQLVLEDSKDDLVVIKKEEDEEVY